MHSIWDPHKNRINGLVWQNTIRIHLDSLKGDMGDLLFSKIETDSWKL